MKRRSGEHLRLRVWFAAAGTAVWAAPFVYGMARSGFDGRVQDALIAIAVLPLVSYFLYFTYVRTRAGSIFAGVVLGAMMAAAHVVVALSSAAGDEQAGILYIYIPLAAALVVGAVSQFESRGLGKRQR
ncbi:MAG: hypothetical protein M3217_00680 [Actinomycetota bacterium]|nr:hypothetical protein [Actinomycetota bacterium]